MTLVRYNPLNDFLPGTLGDLIESVLRDAPESKEQFTPAVDVFKDDKNIEIHLVAPGMKKEDFRIDLHENQLEITGERTVDKEKQPYLQRRESGYGKFKKTFKLSETINQEKVSANYIDGILSVQLPLFEKQDKKSIIKVQ